MIRTGEQYIESIRDDRGVWIDGERVDDVVTHPEFKPIVDVRARVADRALRRPARLPLASQHRSGGPQPVGGALDAEVFQVHVHAVGDATARYALDAFEQARQMNGSRESRHHIAHIDLAHPDDFPRFVVEGEPGY